MNRQTILEVYAAILRKAAFAKEWSKKSGLTDEERWTAGERAGAFYEAAAMLETTLEINPASKEESFPARVLGSESFRWRGVRCRIIGYRLVSGLESKTLYTIRLLESDPDHQLAAGYVAEDLLPSELQLADL